MDRGLCAELATPFVVFLIRPRRDCCSNPWSWAPLDAATPRMLAELAGRLELAHDCLRASLAS